jgi:proteic killer suppression protein
MAIKSFGHKGLKEFFASGSKRGIQPSHARKLEDILDRLDSAAIIDDMAYSGSFLHPLKGELEGRWSVRVSGNWRVTFLFKEGDVYEVSYIDYH